MYTQFRFELSNTSGYQYKVPHPSHTPHATFDCITYHLSDTLSRDTVIKYCLGVMSTIVMVLG